MFGQRPRTAEIPLRPRFPVIVSSNCNNGRDTSQFIEHFGTADVAGVENQTYIVECLERFGPQKSVSVRDNADDFLADAGFAHNIFRVRVGCSGGLQTAGFIVPGRHIVRARDNNPGGL